MFTIQFNLGPIFIYGIVKNLLNYTTKTKLHQEDFRSNCIEHRIHRIFLDFFSRPVFKKTRRFGNWICFRPQVKVGEKTPTQLGPLERPNLNH
jgi:hypothetical protein